LAEKGSDKLAVFDAILLDAPCTATGVIRRHPDISILRSEEDIE
jgi:16S rRNA (cytosine967-C5)-methyltransferase